MSLRVVVAYRKSEQSPVLAEIDCSQGIREFGWGFVLWFWVLVPRRVVTISSNCGKCPILPVECNPIETVGPCWLNLISLLSVAFKVEVFWQFIVCSLKIYVSYAASALDWSKRKSFAIWEAGNRCCFAIQRRLNHFGWCKVLWLQICFKIPHMQQSILMSSHQQRKRKAHVVHRHRNITISDQL